MSNPIKPKPSFGVPKTDYPGVLARGNLMYTAILMALALFPQPPVAMAAFLLLLQAAAASQSAAATGTKGLASVRNTKMDALWTAMKSLKTYVEGLCSTADAITAASMIEAAGLLVAKTGKRTKLLLAATYVPATSMVHLIVNASLLIGKRTSKKTVFSWSWSTDGGKTYNSGVSTGYAVAEIPNLPPGNYQFRVSATVGKVVGEWSQSVNLTIH